MALFGQTPSTAARPTGCNMPFVMHYSGLKYRPPSTRINARRSRARAPRSSADDNDKRPDAPPTPQPTRAAFTIDDPAQTIVWGGNLPSPRRMFLGTLGATTVGACTRVIAHVVANSAVRARTRHPPTTQRWLPTLPGAPAPSSASTAVLLPAPSAQTSSTRSLGSSAALT